MLLLDIKLFMLKTQELMRFPLDIEVVIKIDLVLKMKMSFLVLMLEEKIQMVTIMYMWDLVLDMEYLVKEHPTMLL